MIDFEAKFAVYLHEYKKKQALSDEALDDIAPQLYLKWLDTKKPWLDGVSPVAYFKSFDAPKLIELLGGYIISDVTLPGALLNEIADTNEQTYPYLITLLKNYDGEKNEDVKRTIVRIIEEMDLEHPYDYYIDVIAGADEKDDFVEACVQELKNSGEGYIERLVVEYEQAKNTYVSDCLLDVLCDISFDERVYQFALEKFMYTETNKAFCASCLGKLGNADAVSHLEEALRNEETGYYDYMAVKNALEELGGEVTIDRDFSGDSDYEALKKEALNDMEE
ncbi:MAG: hypothetical protein HN948_03180 [Clostridia bacterium]|nr:hypothetical protein [Clostridia bacterium]MBT7121996.1 hypothetical protein [Clostridia bacterium]